MDYATLENVEVEVGEDGEGRMSPPAKNSSSHNLSFRLLMSKNSEGRPEQISLVAESRYLSVLQGDIRNSSVWREGLFADSDLILLCTCTNTLLVMNVHEYS